MEPGHSAAGSSSKRLDFCSKLGSWTVQRRTKRTQGPLLRLCPNQQSFPTPQGCFSAPNKHRSNYLRSYEHSTQVTWAQGFPICAQGLPPGLLKQNVTSPSTVGQETPRPKRTSPRMPSAGYRPHLFKKVSTAQGKSGVETEGEPRLFPHLPESADVPSEGSGRPCEPVPDAGRRQRVGAGCRVDHPE